MKTFILLTLAAALSTSLSLPARAADAVPTTKIAPHVTRANIAGIDLIIYPTSVKDVVTFRGAMPGGDAFAGEGNIAIPTLTGMMLDKGTTTEDKFAITQKLESVGATLGFSVSSTMVEINGKALKKDVPLVVALLAEQLRSPAFSPEEFEKAKKLFSGGLQRSLESTDEQASETFTRAVYPAGHPNRQPPTDEMLAAIASAKVEDAKAFHAKVYGPAHLTLVVVGDVDLPQLKAAMEKSFAGWTGGVAVPTVVKSTGTDAPHDQNVYMADKTSVTVIFGQASSLRYSDPDYQALRLGTAIFGRGFTGRLMATVRDQEGLTYGIDSYLSNDTFSDGDWKIEATFAPAMLEKGLTSTKHQLNLWYDNGVTAEEVSARKSDLIGTFKVALATTGGMASSLLAAVNRGYDVTWLDEYPDRVNAITTDQVNGAIKKYLKPDDMYLIKAGTVPGLAPAAK